MEKSDVSDASKAMHKKKYQGCTVINSSSF